MNTYVAVLAEIHVFLISALVGGGCSVSRPGHFTPGKSPWYPYYATKAKIKLSLCLLGKASCHEDMGAEVYIHVFLTLA
jgi:hypothetical protein